MAPRPAPRHFMICDQLHDFHRHQMTYRIAGASKDYCREHRRRGQEHPLARSAAEGPGCWPAASFRRRHAHVDAHLQIRILRHPLTIYRLIAAQTVLHSHVPHGSLRFLRARRLNG